MDPAARRHLRPKRLKMTQALRNFCEILRAYALERVATLSGQLSPLQISERLYNTNRCGIAHGNLIRRHDLDLDFKDVVGNLKLIHYLSRVIIEQHL
jgi:hypothetical protein